MICVVSDTHREAGHGLSGRTLETARAADLVVHAGDFTADAALSALAALAGSGSSARVEAVAGNSDDPALRDRLPRVRVVDHRGVRLVVTHGDGHSETSLSLLGREHGADLVVFGHTHRPRVVETGDVVLLNPGSPTTPRGGPAAHAKLHPEERYGRLVAVGGEAIETFGWGAGGS